MTTWISCVRSWRMESHRSKRPRSPSRLYDSEPGRGRTRFPPEQRLLEEPRVPEARHRRPLLLAITPPLQALSSDYCCSLCSGCAGAWADCAVTSQNAGWEYDEAG